MSAKKFYSLEVEEREADLVIFGDITSWPWLESDVSAYNLQQEIAALDVDKINVHINSYGGEVAEALAITNTLIRHPAQVVTYVDGFACSAATIIFMAGEQRIMSAYSNFLVHPVWTIASGNAEDLRSAANDLDAITEQSIKAYMTGVTKSRAELEELMSEERFLTPEETLEWGFATEIEEADDDEAKPAASVREQVFQLVQQDKKQIEEEFEVKTDGMIDISLPDVISNLFGLKDGQPENVDTENDPPDPDEDKVADPDENEEKEPDDPKESDEEKPEDTAISRFFNAF